MNWLKRPQIWFPSALILLIVVGAKLLNNPTCQSLDERDWQWYAEANSWRSTFDAVSAACGVGLLTHDVDEEYTPVGKWTLSAIGVTGAVLWIAAILSASRRFWSAAGTERSLPPARYAVGAFAALVVISIAATTSLEWVVQSVAGVSAPGDGFAGSVWRAISAVASLGWLPGTPERAYAWIYATVGLVGGLGWMLWLLPIAKIRREFLRTWTIVRLASGHVAYLLVVAALIFLLESPRGQRTTSGSSAQLNTQPAAARYGRCLAATVCAATAGIPTEELSEENVTDGSKFVLGGSVLIGSLVGSAGGGIKFALFAWFITVGTGTICARRRSLAAATIRRLTVAGASIGLLFALTCATAFGLLVIEARNARNYQEQPTFAAAFLDASSAVGGANLSSGIAHAVTGQNLSSGIRQRVDSYQYGMALLIGAMFIGRTLLVLVLGWPGGLRLTDSESVQQPEPI